MKKIAIIFVLTLLPLVSFAAINVEKRSDAVTMRTSSNIYQAGGAVGVFEKAPGDVYAAGGTVSITADVNEDVVVAGGNLSFTSAIGGDLRAVGGNINISGPVNGDLIAAGGQVNIIPSSVVKGDFLVAGGTIDVGGLMKGNGRIFGKDVYISGTLNKDIYVKASRLVIEKTAVINGNIDYKGEEEAVIHEGAKVNGKIAFSRIAVKSASPINLGWQGILGVISFVKFLMMLISALILFFLVKSTAIETAEKTLGSFWKELLRGLVLLIVIPVIAIILFVTVIGSFVGIFAIALYVLLIILGSVFSGIVFAELVNKLIFSGPKAKKLSWPMVILGVLVIGILSYIPFVGWIICFAFFLAGLGAVSNLLYRQMKALQK